MARFYFHFFDGTVWTTDDIGLELPSAEQAYIEAVKGARAIWSELMEARSDPRVCSFRVTGEQGAELFEMRLADLLEDCATRE